MEKLSTQISNIKQYLEECHSGAKMAGNIEDQHRIGRALVALEADPYTEIFLENVLEDTIKEATPKEDYLTSRIYQYCRETHKFICVTPEKETDDITDPVI